MVDFLNSAFFGRTLGRSSGRIPNGRATNMRMINFLVAILAFTSSVNAQTDIENLIADTQPEIQEQINRVYDLSCNPARDARQTKYEALEELQRLKGITEDKGEIVKQLAIFVAMTESEEDMHLFAAGTILQFLELPPSIPIRVLAPYLDAENENLRNFAGGWFHNHDSNERTHGNPPLGSVNYHEYMEYVRSRLNRNEDIPPGFIKFIYERHPGKALLVFAYANRHTDAAAQLREIHKALEAARQGRERTPAEIRQLRANG